MTDSDPAKVDGAEIAPEDLKAKLRRVAYDARRAESNKDAASHAAIERLVQLPAYDSAQTVLWYVDCRTELRTRWYLPTALASSKRIVVPYCTTVGDTPSLGLWKLAALDELAVGKWKILEPPPERWNEPGRVIAPNDLDCVVVPGVGFTRQGIRLGNGQGYYDRLLAQVRKDCTLIGLGFECQVLDELPTDSHDVAMNWIVTERQVYEPGSADSAT